MIEGFIPTYTPFTHPAHISTYHPETIQDVVVYLIVTMVTMPIIYFVTAYMRTGDVDYSFRYMRYSCYELMKIMVRLLPILLVVTIAIAILTGMIRFGVNYLFENWEEIWEWLQSL